jgi:hypothetical protein
MKNTYFIILKYFILITYNIRSLFYPNTTILRRFSMRGIIFEFDLSTRLLKIGTKANICLKGTFYKLFCRFYYFIIFSNEEFIHSVHTKSNFNQHFIALCLI